MGEYSLWKFTDTYTQNGCHSSAESSHGCIYTYTPLHIYLSIIYAAGAADTCQNLSLYLNCAFETLIHVAFCIGKLLNIKLLKAGAFIWLYFNNPEWSSDLNSILNEPQQPSATGCCGKARMPPNILYRDFSNERLRTPAYFIEHHKFN